MQTLTRFMYLLHINGHQFCWLTHMMSWCIRQVAPFYRPNASTSRSLKPWIPSASCRVVTGFHKEQCAHFAFLYHPKVMMAVSTRDALYFRLYAEHGKVLGNHHSCLYHKTKEEQIRNQWLFYTHKKEIVNEILPEKGEFRDTYQIHQLIANTGRSGKR